MLCGQIIFSVTGVVLYNLLPLTLNPTENMKKVIATHYIFVKFRIVLFIVKLIFYKKKKKKT